MSNETAVFGGGCFWCTEAIFKELKGVNSVMSGYAGGTTPNPTYESVSSGTTGHAEAIKIKFDPEQIAYKDLLAVFFATHDPTTVNRQGNDVGTQYRSLILYVNDVQKSEAEAYIRELNESHSEGQLIMTQVEPLSDFYEAEEYHQNYYANNQDKPYCQIVINPKLTKAREQFKNLLRKP